MISLGKKVDLEVFVEGLHFDIHEVNERVFRLRILTCILFFMNLVITFIVVKKKVY